MTDKEEIKFAIRYLKKGLKSKRTPPLYEELMNELGFVKKDKINDLICIAEVRLAYWQKYEGENKELKKKVENLQKYLDTQNCYRECAETWEKLTYAKTIIQDLLDNTDEYARQRAEDFLKENK